MSTDRNILTRERLQHAMRLCRTAAKAAQMLGAHRVSVSKACKRYGIPLRGGSNGA